MRDLKKIRDDTMRRRVRQAIERVEAAQTTQEVPNLAAISGESDLYRIRAGDYRIGIVVAEGGVEFVRCLHRRDVYKYFP